MGEIKGTDSEKNGSETRADGNYFLEYSNVNSSTSAGSDQNSNISTSLENHTTNGHLLTSDQYLPKGLSEGPRSQLLSNESCEQNSHPILDINKTTMKSVSSNPRIYTATPSNLSNRGEPHLNNVESIDIAINDLTIEDNRENPLDIRCNSNITYKSTLSTDKGLSDVQLGIKVNPGLSAGGEGQYFVDQNISSTLVANHFDIPSAGSYGNEQILSLLTSHHFVPTQEWPCNTADDAFYIRHAVEEIRSLGGQTTISKLRGLLKHRFSSKETIKSVPLKALLAAYPKIFTLNRNNVYFTRYEHDIYS